MFSFYVSFRMGLLQKPTILSYFNRQHVLSTPVFSRLIRTNKCEQLRKMIQSTDPENKNCGCSLRKIQAVVSKYKLNYTFKEIIAID